MERLPSVALSQSSAEPQRLRGMGREFLGRRGCPSQLVCVLDSRPLECMCGILLALSAALSRASSRARTPVRHTLDDDAYGRSALSLDLFREPDYGHP